MRLGSMGHFNTAQGQLEGLFFYSGNTYDVQGKGFVRAATVDTNFKIGITMCWAPLLALPLGLLAIGGGPCAGPRNIAGSTILLVVGFAALAAPLYGVVRVLQSFRLAATTRLFGIISALCACMVAVIGGFYLLIGIVSLREFLR
jgi:hypothetical protein